MASRVIFYALTVYFLCLIRAQCYYLESSTETEPRDSTQPPKDEHSSDITITNRETTEPAYLGTVPPSLEVLNFKILRATPTSLEAIWNFSSHADGFRVIFHSRNGVQDKRYIFRGDMQTFSFNELEPQTKYNVSITGFVLRNGFRHYGKEYITSAETSINHLKQPGFVKILSTEQTGSRKLRLVYKIEGRCDGLKTKVYIVGRHSVNSNRIKDLHKKELSINHLVEGFSYNLTLSCYVRNGNLEMVGAAESAILKITAQDKTRTNKKTTEPAYLSTVPPKEKQPGNITNLGLQPVNSSAIRLSWILSGYADGFVIKLRQVNTQLLEEYVLTDSRLRTFDVHDLETWSRYEINISTYTDYPYDSMKMLGFPATGIERTHPEEPARVKDLKIVESRPTFVSLKWSKPRDTRGPLNGYEVTYCTNLTCNIVNTEEPKVSISNLRPLSEYRVSVRAYNKLPNETKLFGRNETFRFKTPDGDIPPGRIKDLVTITVNSSAIAVLWEVEGFPDGFSIEFHDGFFNEMLLVKNGTVRSQLLTYLKQWTWYNITVTPFVVIKDGMRLNGEGLTVKKQTWPEAPTKVKNLHVSEKSSTELTLQWSPPEDPRGPLSGYGISYCLRKGMCLREFSKSTTHTVKDLKPMTSYLIQVNAFNRRQDGKNIDGPMSNVVERTAAGAPSEPTHLEVISKDPDDLRLSWKAPVIYNGNLDGYMVHFCHNFGSCITDKLGNFTEFTIQGLIPGADYSAEITAFNIEDGAFVKGQPATVYFQTLKRETGHVEDLHLATPSEGTVKVCWNKPMGTGIVNDGYFVLWCLGNHCKEREIQETETTLHDLQPGDIYKVAVVPYQKGTNGRTYTGSVVMREIRIPDCSWKMNLRNPIISGLGVGIIICLSLILLSLLFKRYKLYKRTKIQYIRIPKSTGNYQDNISSWSFSGMYHKFNPGLYSKIGNSDPTLESNSGN